MKTKVVILGVNHAYQLVSKECQPAVYRAFFDRVKPDVIGIERSPEEFSTSNFYEFTYEQQNILLPYSRERGIPLRPIDWIPSSNDQILAWKVPDIEQPQFIRGDGGYKTFLVFPQLEEDFFYSEKEIIKERIIQWRDTYRRGENDFPRRLFQYRTYMQAMRVKLIVQDYPPGSTVLIVVGHMHKPDLEGILSSSDFIQIMNPSEFGYPNEKEIRANILKEDLLAICSFNLLGLQANYHVDVSWLESVVEELMSGHVSSEISLFDIRQKRISNKYSNKDVISLYESLLDRVGHDQFTYTGVKDHNRIDSYFNPFGNLSVKNRLYIELIREHLESFNWDTAEGYKKKLLSSDIYTVFQLKQLEVYINMFLESKSLKTK